MSYTAKGAAFGVAVGAAHSAWEPPNVAVRSTQPPPS